MALSSTIAADFSDFVGECQKADQGLAEIQAEATKTETALAEMGDTATTSAKSSGDALATVGRSAKQAGGDVKGMKDGLQVADQALDALGINVGGKINDLKQLGSVSLDTSTAIGKLGTAVSVASAAMIGWQIGRKIAELTGSDKIIGDATASILGWRDAGQAAANNADVLRRAFEKTGQVFTDVHAASEALRAASRANAEEFNTGAQRVKGWEAELKNAKGGVAALKAEIEGGNSTTAQMASHFKVSGEAVEYLKRKMTESDAALKAFNAEQDKAAQKAQQSADAMQRLRDSMFGTDSIAKANEYLAALGPIENLTKMSAAAQASMNAELGKAIDAYTRMGQTAPQAIRDIYTATLPLPPIVAGLGAEWASVGEKVSVSTEQIVGDLKKQSDAYKKQLADFETETQRQVDAWNRGERGADQVKRKIEETTEATRQLTTAQLAANEAVAGMGVRAAASASEVIAMGRQLESMYRQAGIFVSGIQVAMGGYTQSLRQQAGREITGAGVAWGTGAGATSTANTLNVNVNSTDASKIAEKLVGEMKHAGYRL